MVERFVAERCFDSEEKLGSRQATLGHPLASLLAKPSGTFTRLSDCKLSNQRLASSKLELGSDQSKPNAITAQCATSIIEVQCLPIHTVLRAFTSRT